jgi:DNA mismatch endonuclease, patch repair protein
MSRIRGSGNKNTELRLISFFKAAQITGWRRGSRAIGRPDFVFPQKRIAVFVDGCYWHGCPRHSARRNQTEYWKDKIAKNRQRDRRVTRALREQGWRVLRVWEHELAKKDWARLCKKVHQVLG